MAGYRIMTITIRGNNYYPKVKIWREDNNTERKYEPASASLDRIEQLIDTDQHWLSADLVNGEIAVSFPKERP